MGRAQRIDDRTILAAARRVILERGPSASTREIARAAGVSQAVLFQRFRTRDDLVLAAMMPPPPELHQLLGPPLDPSRAAVPAYLVEVGLRALEFFVEAAPAFFHLVVHPSFRAEVFARVHEHVPIVPLVAGLAERLEELARAGLVAPVDARVVSEALMGFVHNLAMFSALAGAPLSAAASRDRVERFVDVLWRGLAPTSTGMPPPA